MSKDVKQVDEVEYMLLEDARAYVISLGITSMVEYRLWVNGEMEAVERYRALKKIMKAKEALKIVRREFPRSKAIEAGRIVNAKRYRVEGSSNWETE